MHHKVIAQGEVSCFVLSEEDWRMLHEDAKINMSINEKEVYMYDISTLITVCTQQQLTL
jgi:hypothetical protein